MRTLRSVLCGGHVAGGRPRLTAVVVVVSFSFLLFLYSSVVIRMKDSSPWKPLHLFTNWTSWHVTNARRSSSNSSATTSATTTPLVVHNVTVVTGFLDIGEFGKGTPHNKRDWRIYQRWSSAYEQLQAPVVMYTNSPSFARHFLSVRRHLQQLTVVRQVNLTELWAFRLQPEVAAIYSRGYPRHWPNTVYPQYTCVTHAKFDLLQDVMDRGLFPSRHIAWMDIGYLRDVVGKNNTYIMWPPSNFDPRRVLCGEIFTPDFNKPWKSILRNNVNWVAGGFFLARHDVMRTFVEQYRRAVTSFLRQQESQVEQHILYAMYTREGRAIVHPTVELQAPHGGWFSAGFSCLHLNSTSTRHSTPPPSTPHHSTPPPSTPHHSTPPPSTPHHSPSPPSTPHHSTPPPSTPPHPSPPSLRAERRII